MGFFKTFIRQFHASCKCHQQSIREMQKKSTRSTKDRGYVLLIIPVATFGLGTWQIQRRKWKLNLIDELQSKTTAPPVDFPLDIVELADLEYRKVRVKGQYDHSKELYMVPRQLLSTDEESGRGLVSHGRTSNGAHVITPFKLEDRELTILVNRGWVPQDKTNPTKRLEGQIQGPVEIVGVVRKTEKRQQFGGKNDVAHNRWLNRDIELMAKVTESDPVLIDADKNSTVDGGPVGGQTRVTLRNEHLSYIITWYSLSAITLGMWLQRYWR